MKKLALAGFSVFFTLCLAEGVLRLSGFSFDFVPEFGFPRPRHFGRILLSDPELLWVSRDYEERLEAIQDGERPDILFLGDSCTQFGKYPEFFASKMEERGRGPLHFGELGVTGWTTFQGLQQLQRDVVPLRPRFITLYYGWNDHWYAYGLEDRSIIKLSNAWYSDFDELRLLQALTRFRYASLRSEEGEEPERVPPEYFEENLRAMVRIAREHGIVPVLLTAPSAHERGREPEKLARRWLKDLSQLVPIHQRYVEIVREVAAAEQVALCDLERRFTEEPQNLVRETYFMEDGIHLFEQGYDRLSDFLVDCFTEQPELRALGRPDPPAAAGG